MDNLFLIKSEQLMLLPFMTERQPKEPPKGRVPPYGAGSFKLTPQDLTGSMWHSTLHTGKESWDSALQLSQIPSGRIWAGHMSWLVGLSTNTRRGYEG